MLYHLLYEYLRQWIGGFNIFGYISFRAAMAAVTAFVLCMLCGPPVIRYLKTRNILEEEGKTDSEVLNRLRETKPRTPTMGGCIILFGILCSTLLWGRLDNRFIQLGILGTLGFGIIGFIDDYIKLVYYNRKGLKSGSKLRMQVAVSLALTFAVFILLKRTGNSEYMRVYLPVGKSLYIDLSFWGGTVFFFFALFVIVGTSNAVNLTDGLDGLAPGLMLITSVAMAVICYVTGRSDFTEYLKIPYVPGSGELPIFCAAMAGATMGFLWFNCYPAQVFMGDTGSLSLGGLLGFIAVACKQEILLFIVGGVFFIEVLSVILQVGSFRLRGGKRVFLCAPLHHHFQFKQWADPKITVRFWIIGVILAIIGLSTLKMH
jgi:phospho-N-acetylmuramoyl-pentapeptide-transferase